ncbi:MAG: hypothetical protein IPK24_06795 [Kineosporiaceae bacterium]|nr:hypothetical protein [Kineosporiaceae bacterium]
MPLLNDVDVVDRALAGLADVGLRAVRRGEGVVVHAGDGAHRRYRLVVRDRMTAPVAGAIEAPGEAAGAATLVVAPFVPEPAAVVLRGRGVDYVDAAGNVSLRWGGVWIDVRGRRRVVADVPVTAPSARRPFTRSGAQVTFCLLSWPQLCATSVREIAAASGTAVGTAQAVLQDLITGGYLVGAGAGRRLVRGGELLTRWAEAYALSLYASLELGTYHVEDPRWWTDAGEELLDAGVDLGGEAAASRMDAHLRPSGAILYAETVPAGVLAAHRCRRVQRPDEANVVVRRRFWTVPQESDRTEPQGLAPSVLVYADLLVSGDPRQREHALRVRSGDARLRRLDGS